jgi:hypothetical protein
MIARPKRRYNFSGLGGLRKNARAPSGKCLKGLILRLDGFLPGSSIRSRAGSSNPGPTSECLADAQLPVPTVSVFDAVG